MWPVPPRASASPPPVDIRLVRTHDEFAACEAMSRDIWGAAERNRGLPSDRLEAEWWLRRTKPLPAGDPVVMLRVGGDGEPVREQLDMSPGTTLLISVPPDFQAVKRASPELALRWRMESRAAFEAALTAGLVAVDFRRDGTYVMALAPAGAARVET